MQYSTSAPRPLIRKFAQISLLALMMAMLLLAGFQLRNWTWEKTAHLRFQHDIANGFYWGSQTLVEARRLSPDASSAGTWISFFRGYFALYDRVRREASPNDYQLDYPPLRLLVMSIWTKHVRQEFPGVEDGMYVPNYSGPLLCLNLLCEMVSAFAIFILVRLWVRRASGATGSRLLGRIPQKHLGWICGMAAATVAWLDSSLILNAHGWPQWDVWILPFYLLAAIAISRNRWFWCGCLLAVGAMLKGQLMLVAPFFIFLPLWQKKWKRALHVVIGFVSTAAAIVSPWLLRTSTAWMMVLAISIVTFALLIWTRLAHAGVWTAGVAAVTAFAEGYFAGGTFSWLQVGFLYGCEKYPYLFVSSCYNLPWLLADFGWGLKDSLMTFDVGPVHFGITPQVGLRLIYMIALAFCALGAARHIRNRNPRLLIAIATPWLLMFTLLGQMHERYLMWGGVVSSVALGVSVRLTVLRFVISIVSTVMILHTMLIDKKLDATLEMIEALNSARPYACWVIIVSAAIWLWETVSTCPRKSSGNAAMIRSPARWAGNCSEI